jgi:threonine synthase
VQSEELIKASEQERFRQPVRLLEAVEAIRSSGGAAYAVPEAEIHAAVRALSARGLHAESTSSVAAAALDHFIAIGEIAPDETTVVMLTGAGLKSAEKMAAVFAKHGDCAQ